MYAQGLFEKCAEYSTLEELALDLFWSWNHGGDQIWQRLNPKLWQLTHNPWLVLQSSSPEHLQVCLADPAFARLVGTFADKRSTSASLSSWFQRTFPSRELKSIAYFSMEYMLSEALPIYSGGLGNVAGDQLKAASDLGIPLVAVGLLYQQGYFRQVVDKQGIQHALYPYNDPGQLPITPVRLPNGEWLRLEVALPGRSIWLRAWEVRIGTIKLYLLDSNDAANRPIHRAITSELYGGNQELRLQQEILLGIGGWRLLEALSIDPDVCHLNEGHAAFLILERARAFMLKTSQPFDVALAATRAGNLFTTHTAVPAGFDRFPPVLIDQYLSYYAQNQLSISPAELMALGRLHGNDQNEDFNMAYLAIRGCGAINGVSRLHGEVCRQIFSSLFPRWPLHEVPVGHVTNGVHIPTWSSAETNKLWKDCCGKRFWEAATTDLESAIGKISDEQIWALRSSGRQATINYARERLASQLAERGADSDAIEAARRIFDPETLILGFARRFATYKRPNMLLFDKERFLRLLKSQCRPVQLIIAGKAHPADLPGQALIREWAQFISLPEVRPHVIFLEDYNMSVTEQLVRGVDVWLNTPRRPWEACGTSGMKVLANGGLNLSELDGWWAEAYTPDVGWALDGTVEASPADVDRLEAERLYTLLEEQVIPEFYNRDSQGLPARWIARIRKSMASLTPQYSAHRAVKQYAEELYVPAAQAYHRRAEHQGALASQIDEWKRAVSLSWPAVRFVTFAVDTREDYHHFELQVYLDNLPKGAASVELYSEEQVYAMECVGPLAAANTFLYHVAVPATVAVKLFTPRIVPYNSALEIPLEAAHIHWLQ